MPDFDTSGLDALAVEFAAAAKKIVPALVPVAHKAGVGIKRTMVKDATGHRNLPTLPRFVEYDVDAGPTSVTVEVGFRQEGAGNLANIAAFGTTNNAPVTDITRGLYEELPKFMAFAAAAAAKAL